MDEALLEKLDMAPLKPLLDEIDAIKDKAAFTHFMAASHADFGSTLFGAGVLPDFNNPTINTAIVGTSGMGLPDRDYYLLDKYKPQRDAYRAYIERVLTMTGTPNASAAADTVLAFETEIAKLSWTQTELRDIDKLNNPMTPAELAAYAPGSTGRPTSRTSGSAARRS
jgi:putative endopeptidase